MDTDFYLIKLNDQSTDLCQFYAPFLNKDEQNWAAGFATPLLQNRCITTRGWLRYLLSAYTKQAPAELQFQYAEQGKPALVDYPKLQFNLAHSGDYGVLVVTENDPVGVDIEQESRMQDCINIAKRFFTPKEHQALLNSDNPQLLFCHIWTQKEAFLKATGKGIGFGLDQFEVSIDLNQVGIDDIQDHEFSTQDWHSTLVSAAPGYRIVVTKANALKVNMLLSSSP